jgi:hypothetical protein
MTMDTTESGLPARISNATRDRVSLSKWVNEKLPALDQILSARDVARLTRRRWWVVHALTLFGKIPRQQRFHGRAIGWAKRDLENCLVRDPVPQQTLVQTRRCMRKSKCTGKGGQTTSHLLLQRMLPMHLPNTRRWRESCRSRRVRGKP